MARTAAIILAGGRSSRMGRDKALIQIDGLTLLDRARATARTAGADAVIVAGRREVADGLADPVPDQGPAVAARHALAAAAAQDFAAAWVMAVDTPLLSVRLLHRLRDAAAPAAAFANHPLPFYVRLDHAAAADSAATSVHALLDDLGARRLPVTAGEQDELAGVNTPEELARAADRLTRS